MRVFPLAVGLAAVLASGLVHGLWTDRWGLSNEPAASAAKLDRVPLALGPWESRVWEVDTQTLTIGRIAGYLSRSFSKPRVETPLSVLIVCGRPGPIAQHAPEVCMVGEGWEITRMARCTLEAEGLAAPAEFWSAVFQKTDGAVPVYRRVFWAWTSDGAWEAPEHPRLKYAGRAALYKMYIVRPMARENEPLWTRTRCGNSPGCCCRTSKRPCSRARELICPAGRGAGGLHRGSTPLDAFRKKSSQGRQRTGLGRLRVGAIASLRRPPACGRTRG